MLHAPTPQSAAGKDEGKEMGRQQLMGPVMGDCGVQGGSS